MSEQEFHAEPGLGLPQFLRFADLAVDGLGRAREEIDALNVFPVPDGDTGTNLYLTLEAARDAVVSDHSGDLGVALSKYSRGALLGARGNSGVILSQLFGALLRRLARTTPDQVTPAIVAEAMTAAADAAYAAVGSPQEGTILSVARGAADAATASAQAGETLDRVLLAIVQGARTALARTPEQLKALRDAGVVDAGGRGLVVVLEAAEAAIMGRQPVETGPVGPARPQPIARPTQVPGDQPDLDPDGPSYEVMYLLDASDDAIPALKDALTPLGDSLVVVGGDGLWNVHVHVDDVGAAIEAGIAAGAPYRIRVTHFAEQIARAHERRPQGGRSIVAFAAGPGLAELFTEAGATVIEGRRPSTGEVLAAIEQTGAVEVIVLPNDGDSIAVCEAAAKAAEGVRVVVIPTRAQVQGIAALAVHEPGRSLEEDVVAMTSAARHARHGAVTIAAKQAMTSAGPCEAGDALGVIEGDFVLVGQDADAVARGVLDRLLHGPVELVTLVAGEGGTDLAEGLAAYVEGSHRGVDVVVYDGGQPRYPLLVSVE